MGKSKAESLEVSLWLEISVPIFYGKPFISLFFGHLLVCKSKNFGSWVYQLMIQFIVLFSFFLQDYISFIFSSVFFFVVFFFWGCSFPFKTKYFLSLRVSEIHLFYNLQLFYWHFLEFLWLFIF